MAVCYTADIPDDCVFGKGDSCLCFLVATICDWSPFLLASLMRCENADDCKLLKPAHGQSDVL